MLTGDRQQTMDNWPIKIAHLRSAKKRKPTKLENGNQALTARQTLAL